MPAGSARGGSGDGASGVLVVDKPAGPTSHDVVAVVRRRLHGIKAGHTGTLDPFATGVLPIVVGRATRLARYLSGAEKEYDAVIRLGLATDTCDRTGQPVFEAPAGFAPPAIDVISAVLAGYRGSWLQTPPAYSAKLAGGVRAYEQARRGEPVDLPPVAVTVSELEVLSVQGPLVRVRLVSSAGFYVRALAHDVGRKLGTGAVLDSLRRLRSGPFGLGQAVTLDEVAHADVDAHLLPLASLLPDWPAVVLTGEGIAWVSHGRSVGPAQCERGSHRVPPGVLVRVCGPEGRLLAIGQADAGGVLHPTVVLV